MISKEDKEAFAEHVNETLVKTYLPLIFSKEQIDEMKKPFHNVHDHIHGASIGELNEKLEHVQYTKPQVCISDPRISDELIDRLPNTIDIEFKGKTYNLPVRVYKYAPIESIAKWKQGLEQVYRIRALLSKIEPSIKDEYNLISSQDYDVSLSNGPKGLTLMISFRDKAMFEKNCSDLREHVEDKLKALDDQEIKDVLMIGPLEYH